MNFTQAQYNGVNQGRCGECGDEWNPRLMIVLEIMKKAVNTDAASSQRNTHPAM